MNSLYPGVSLYPSDPGILLYPGIPGNRLPGNRCYLGNGGAWLLLTGSVTGYVYVYWYVYWIFIGTDGTVLVRVRYGRVLVL